MSAIKSLGHSFLTQLKDEDKIYPVKKEQFLKEKGDYLGYNIDESPVISIFLFSNGVETFSFSGGWNYYLCTIIAEKNLFRGNPGVLA